MPDRNVLDMRKIAGEDGGRKGMTSADGGGRQLEKTKAREPMPVRGPSKLLRAEERQAVKELPQPQPPVAFGLLKVKPLPWKVDT